MTEAVWTVAVDLNADEDFADANEDLSAYVLAAEWQIGFVEPYQVIARDSSLRLTLRNSDKRFSPENASSALYPNFTRGRALRIQSTFQAVTRTMILGWLGPIRPEPDTRGARRTEVEGEGYFTRAMRAEIALPVQQSKTADQVIDAILQNSILYPPGFGGRWLLGEAGHSELGENTILGALTDYLNAETGKTTFDYIGDQWSRGVSVYGALRDTAGREYGRLFVDRAGTVRFWNRHHFLVNLTVAAIFTDSMSGIEYTYGDDLVNIAKVRARPRKVGASPETLGQIDQAVKINALSTAQVTFRYGDQTSGAKIAGQNALAPVAGTDFTANSAEDGSGTDYTGSVSAAITKEQAASCTVTFTSTAVVPVWIQSGAKVRGTRVTDWGEIEKVVQDDTSVAAYDRQVFNYEHEMDNADDAEGLAYLFVAERKNPRGVVRSMTLDARRSDALMTQCLTRTIGDRITITESQTGVSADYFIIGERHQVEAKQYVVTWYLEPAIIHAFWVLGEAGYSELGETTVLGPA